MSKNILIVFLIAGFIYFSSDNLQASLEDNIDFTQPKFKNLRLTGSQDTTIGFDLSLIVTNQTFLPIYIDYIEGSLIINDMEVGSFFDSRPFVLSPNANTPIDLGIDISSEDIINTIGGVISGQIPTNMFLKGFVVVKGITLNFVRPIINRV